ncbi:hypothetical protein [Nitrobacter winogradskyi]|nr:hypothetical protein [Nitrobacter winogradskyi]
MVDWTDDRIGALSDSGLKNLLANAERKSVDDLVARCRAELEKRNVSKPRKASSKARSGLKDFEHEMSLQLAVVGRRMAEKYDLSEETAKVKSAGVKGFRAHKLVGSDGHAKLGGLQRAGFVAIDRYISYRRCSDIVSLGVFLPKDQDISEHRFFVIAPQEVLDGGKPVDAIRDNHGQKQSADSALMFDDLEAAADAFDKVLARIAA